MKSLRARLFAIFLVALSSVLFTSNAAYACGVGQGDVMNCDPL